MHPCMYQMLLICYACVPPGDILTMKRRIYANRSPTVAAVDLQTSSKHLRNAGKNALNADSRVTCPFAFMYSFASKMSGIKIIT
ncbi:hypothetical protein NECAME_15298 [Necator americanus]|uniref:Uncharacterized protein n=1 Tax=Necator americanus TaxID=51031 RepID=W2SIR7_NECAM|nr:hypothetical protein NECAME_15298 [Necator americanus]ETN69463.1 hypothetical protein NECAME_15298 [Necator americanus]